MTALMTEMQLMKEKLKRKVRKGTRTDLATLGKAVDTVT